MMCNHKWNKKQKQTKEKDKITLDKYQYRLMKRIQEKTGKGEINEES